MNAGSWMLSIILDEWFKMCTMMMNIYHKKRRKMKVNVFCYLFLNVYVIFCSFPTMKPKYFFFSFSFLFKFLVFVSQLFHDLQFRQNCHFLVSINIFTLGVFTFFIFFFF
jgi:hypothetical protein